MEPDQASDSAQGPMRPSTVPVLERALHTTTSWPVDFVAAAVLDATGALVAAVGDIRRPVPIASLTKLFTAAAALVAVEEGTSALDEPAGPEGSTVAHLLAHASGLAPDGMVLCPPATRRIYTNAGFEVLADHLTGRAAMPFERYLTEAVLEPLGLEATRLAGSPASDAVSSVSDLSGLVRAWMTPGRLLAAETLARATRPWFPGLPGVLPGYGAQLDNLWGLGVEIRGDKQPHWTGASNSPGTFGHFGRTGTFLWIDPTVDGALIVLTDRAFGPWALRVWPAISDAVRAGLVTP